MKYNYICIEQHLFHEDIGNYISYGIILEGNKNTVVEDVSCDRYLVEYLVSLLNEHQAHPVHLLDIVEDFIP